VDGPAQTRHDEANWYLNDHLHRVDGPAVITASGRQVWYFDGEIHRVGGPAVINPNGNVQWYEQGMRHRLDGPANIHPNDKVEWHVFGRIIAGSEIEAFREQHGYEDWRKGAPPSG
jgi:hypothetical protein